MYVDPVSYINSHRTEICPKFVGAGHLSKLHSRTKLIECCFLVYRLSYTTDWAMYCHANCQFPLLRSLGRTSLMLHICHKLILFVCIACMWFCLFQWSLSDDLVFGHGVLQLVGRLESLMLLFKLMSILIGSMFVRYRQIIHFLYWTCVPLLSVCVPRSRKHVHCADFIFAFSLSSCVIFTLRLICVPKISRLGLCISGGKRFILL